MKKERNLLFLIIGILLLFNISCKQATDSNISFEEEKNTTPQVYVCPSNESIYVKCNAENYKSMEITVNPIDNSSDIKVYNATESQKTFIIRELQNGREYQVAVKINDKTDVFTFKCTPKEKPYTLEFSPTTLTNKVIVKIIPDKDFLIRGGSIKSLTDDVVIGPSTNGIFHGLITNNGLYTSEIHFDNNFLEYFFTFRDKFVIENIDTIVPKINVFYGAYDSSNEKIILKWENPLDIDFTHSIVTFNGQEYKVNKDQTSLEIPNIKPDNKQYTAQISAFDYVGNKSNSKSVSIKATNEPSILDVNLSKSVFLNTDTNFDTDVTINGLSFEKLDKTIDPTVKIGLFDEQDILQGLMKTTTLDIENNKATAKITLPKNDNKETFTLYLKVKVGGKMTNIRVPIDVTKYPSLHAINTIEKHFYSKYYNDFSQVAFRLQGNNLDLLCPYTLQLYDNNNNKIGNAITISNLSSDSYYHNSDIFIKRPKYAGTYYATISSNKFNQPPVKSNNFYIYNSLTFSSFTIPDSNVKFEETIINAEIKGEGFNNPSYNLDSFKITGSDKNIINTAKLKIIDNNTLQLSLRVPGYESNTAITITCGDQSISSNFKVVK